MCSRITSVSGQICLLQLVTSFTVAVGRSPIADRQQALYERRTTATWAGINTDEMMNRTLGCILFALPGCRAPVSSQTTAAYRWSWTHLNIPCIVFGLLCTAAVKNIDENRIVIGAPPVRNKIREARTKLVCALLPSTCIRHIPII